MRIVVKLGGATIEDAALLHSSAQAVTSIGARGDQAAVVHGGGASLTRLLARLGIPSRFVDGLRVTDAETRDAALMVLAGGINKRLVAALARAGGSAVGLAGGDGGAFRARKLQANGHDLGFVGEICSADPRWLEAIWAQGAVPVVASLAPSADGEYYNINADQMAATCAVACRADALVFLTDVPGVLDVDQSVLPRLTAAAIPGLVQDDVVRGGMRPKLDACRRALAGGVPRVHLLPAAQAQLLPQLIAGDVRAGTEVVA